jgi:hypothetical protein
MSQWKTVNVDSIQRELKTTCHQFEGLPEYIEVSKADWDVFRDDAQQQEDPADRWPLNEIEMRIHPDRVPGRVLVVFEGHATFAGE